MEFTTPQIVTIVVALIGAVSGVLSYLKGRSKDKADAASIITEAALKLSNEREAAHQECKKEIRELRAVSRCQDEKIESQGKKIRSQGEMIEKLTAWIARLERERDDWAEGIMALCRQLRESDMQPVWEPTVPEE
jgi:uncharacterized protein HemX